MTLTRLTIYLSPILLVATGLIALKISQELHPLDYKATLALSRADKKCTELIDSNVIRIHVTLDELTGDDNCSDCIHVGHAKTVNPTTVEGDDDDGSVDTQTIFSPAQNATSITYDNTDGEFPSPFDVNLDKQFPAGSKHATLVEILLDDPTLSFITKGDPAGAAPDPDPEFAIFTTPKAKSDGLFDCLHPLTRDANIAGPYLNKLRFHINSGLADQTAGMPISGGLNIGVLVNPDSNGSARAKKVYIPLYIDPHPQNGG